MTSYLDFLNKIVAVTLARNGLCLLASVRLILA